MKEIEVKARVTSLTDLETKLSEQGYILGEAIHQSDRIFLHQSLQYSGITQGTVVLRIRTTQKGHTLTLKQHFANELDKVELETGVSDPKQMEQMLEKLGYRKVVEVVKSRRTASLKPYTICLDEVAGLGDFIEVEQLVAEGNALELQEEMMIFLESLGVTREQRVTHGYDTLLVQKKS